MPEYDELKAVGVKRSSASEHLYFDAFKTSIALLHYSGVVSIPTTSSGFISACSYREHLTIRNVSTGVVYIELGSTATTFSMPLYPDEIMIITNYIGAVSGITTGSSKNVNVSMLYLS